MIPEFSVKRVKLKVSSDNASLIFTLLMVITLAGYYVYTRSWQHTSPVGFIIGGVLVAVQLTLLKLPWTRNWEAINSGGFMPLAVYNIAIMIGFIWYFPLFSPLALVWAPIIFITVYYRGIIAAVMSSLILLTTTIVVILKDGLPHVSYAPTYAYGFILLSIAFIGVVSRAGHIENGVRVALGKAANKVSEESQQLSTLLNSIADAVAATDTNGNILFLNPAINSLLGTSAALGQPLGSYLKLYDQKNQAVDLAKFFNVKSPASFNDFHFYQKDKEQTDLAIDISPITQSAPGLQQGAIIIMRDITKEKTFDEEKDEFIALTSHELRTPIAVAEANMSLAMLEKSALEPKVRDRLERAHKSVLALSYITNKLITLSEAEQNRLQLVLSPVDIREVFNDLEHKYSKDATTKGLRFMVKIAPELKTVSTSKTYLVEILDNFVSNAFKYTQNGYVLLEAKLSDDKQVVLLVKDTGRGIGKSDKPKIFSKFYQSEEFSTRNVGGTGLGLYVVYKLAAYINAKVWFESELNLGSTFYISIKL